MNAIEQAISALHERIDRSEGCQLCNAEESMWYLINCTDKFEPRFCPQCGRKLKTVMPGEEV